MYYYIVNISIQQEIETIQAVPQTNKVGENTKQPTNEGIHVYLLFSLFKTKF